jgi:hypothetical protein
MLAKKFCGGDCRAGYGHAFSGGRDHTAFVTAILLWGDFVKSGAAINFNSSEIFEKEKGRTKNAPGTLSFPFCRHSLYTTSQAADSTLGKTSPVREVKLEAST